MACAILFVALALALGGVDARGVNRATLPARRLQHSDLETVTRVRVANFSALSDSNDQEVDETELSGRINVTASNEPVMYGAYYLGPDQVKQINATIASELVRSALFLWLLLLFHRCLAVCSRGHDRLRLVCDMSAELL